MLVLCYSMDVNKNLFYFQLLKMKNIKDRFKCGEKMEKKSVVNQQQDYRARLVQTLESFRQYWKSWDCLAEVLLKSEKITEDYLSTMWEDEKFGWDELKKFGHRNINLVFKYREKFQWITYPEFIDYLISCGNYRFEDFLKYLDNFKWLNYEDTLIRIHGQYRNRNFTEKLIEKGSWFTVKTIEMLIDDNKWDIVVNHIDKFEWITHWEILDKLIEWWVCRAVAENPNKFQWISHQEIANKLIEKRAWYILVECLDKFEWLDYPEIANKLIDKWYWYRVAGNLEKFYSVNHQEIANKLIERWEGDNVMYNRTKFYWLKLEEFIKKLIERWEADLIDLRKINHKWFDQLIADGLVKTWGLEYLVCNLENLECILSGNVADQLSEKEDARYQADKVAKNINKFERLNMKWGEMLIQEWYQDIVLQNPEKFWLTKEK